MLWPLLVPPSAKELDPSISTMSSALVQSTDSRTAPSPLTPVSALMLRMPASAALANVSIQINLRSYEPVVLSILLTVVCQNGQLRLSGGSNDLEGRLELCWNETWGTICDGFWTAFESNVACRQLGYQPFDAVPFYNAFFGPGTGPIWLDDVFCIGDEENILDCFHPGLTNIDFCNGHNDDVGVRCMEGEKRAIQKLHL